MEKWGWTLDRKQEKNFRKTPKTNKKGAPSIICWVGFIRRSCFAELSSGQRGVPSLFFLRLPARFLCLSLEDAVFPEGDGLRSRPNHTRLLGRGLPKARPPFRWSSWARIMFPVFVVTVPFSIFRHHPRQKKLGLFEKEGGEWSIGPLGPRRRRLRGILCRP